MSRSPKFSLKFGLANWNLKCSCISFVNLTSSHHCMVRPVGAVVDHCHTVLRQKFMKQANAYNPPARGLAWTKIFSC